MRVVAAIVAVVALGTLPGIVLGHAALVSSDPPAGGTLSTTPHTLTATFDDELTADGSSIVVVNEAGTEVAAGGVSATDRFTLTAELPALPAGPYRVRWTAVSADDAAVERGTYAFNVGGSSASTSPTPTPPPNDGLPGTDLMEAIGALVLAGVVILAVVAIIFSRRRR